MTNNTKARSDEIAAKATKLVNSSKLAHFHLGLHPHPALLVPALYNELMVIADCSHSTAVRHIKASLGLTGPVGRPLNPFPVQRFNYRATDEEAKWIKPELQAYAKKLLEELRND